MQITPRQRFHVVLWILAVLLAATIGRLTWNGHAGLYALAALPILWWLLPSRITVAASVFAYYIGAMLPIATTILGYYPEWPAAAGWGMLAVIAAVNAMPWIIGWAPYSASPPRRAAGLLLAVLVGILPPLGVIAWAHPLLSAGWILPGGAWWSLLAVLILWVLVAWRPAASTVGMSLIAGGALAVGTGLNYTPPPAPANIVGVNTQLQPATSFLAFAKKLNEVDAALRHSSLRPSQVAVLPETTLDEYKASTAPMVGYALSRHVARGPVLSGTTFHENDLKWAGAVLLLKDSPPQFVRARQPLVFALWHPWDENDHYSADWLAPVVFDLAGERVALRICSEDFALFWTLYDFAVDRPTVLVSMSNQWWTRDPLVALTQAQHLNAAARLFNVPVVRAANRAQDASAP